MGKKLSCILGVSSVLLVGGLIVSNVHVLADDSKTYVSLSLSGISAKADNLACSKTIELILDSDGDSIQVPIYNLGVSSSVSLPSAEKSKFFVRYYDLNEGLSYSVLEEGILLKYLDELNSSLPESKDAYFKCEEDDIVLVPEVYGKKLDIYSALSIIKDSLEDRNYSIDLSSYVVNPKVTVESLKSVSEYVNSLKNWGISYSNGDILDFKYLFDCLSVTDSSVSVDKSSLREKLLSDLPTLLKNYTTVGADRTFKTYAGLDIVISGGTYGDSVDLDSEVDYILESLDSLVSETEREPILSLDLPDKLPSTYIEISIDDQHLWYYEDGVLLMETDVVTGTKGVHDTPTGVYYISERIDGKYLVGSNYKTWVNQWMRLTNQGIGLHDAYWRGNFGGTIYTYNGSHGCINLPKNFAKDLFDIVSRKTAVIVY